MAENHQSNILSQRQKAHKLKNHALSFNRAVIFFKKWHHRIQLVQNDTKSARLPDPVFWIAIPYGEQLSNLE